MDPKDFDWLIKLIGRGSTRRSLLKGFGKGLSATAVAGMVGGAIHKADAATTGTGQTVEPSGDVTPVPVDGGQIEPAPPDQLGPDQVDADVLLAALNNDILPALTGDPNDDNLLAGLAAIQAVAADASEDSVNAQLPALVAAVHGYLEAQSGLSIDQIVQDALDQQQQQNGAAGPWGPCWYCLARWWRWFFWWIWYWYPCWFRPYWCWLPPYWIFYIYAWFFRFLWWCRFYGGCW